MFSIRIVTLTALATVALLVSTSPALAADPPATMKYIGGAATPVIRSLKEGNGWCIISERKKVEICKGEQPLDCVRYRVVTKYAVSQIDGANGSKDTVVEITLGEPTDWIAVELKMPTTSGPSITASKAANEAVAQVDTIIPLVDEALAKSKDPLDLAMGRKIKATLAQQRVALVGLIQKDVQAIATVME